MKNDSKSGKKAAVLKVTGSGKVPKYQQRETDSSLIAPKFPLKGGK